MKKLVSLLIIVSIVFSCSAITVSATGSVEVTDIHITVNSSTASIVNAKKEATKVSYANELPRTVKTEQKDSTYYITINSETAATVISLKKLIKP